MNIYFWCILLNMEILFFIQFEGCKQKEKQVIFLILPLIFFL
ncbi:hypothetical protein BMG_4116 [Priestia megaterium]|nr:hypothetical protein BMG_4116 [Priestia megaterium]